MEQSEREKILRIYSNGAKMLSYYEAIGMRSLRDFKNADAEEIATRINIYLGRKHINSLGVQAIQNVINQANKIKD